MSSFDFDLDGDSLIKLNKSSSFNKRIRTISVELSDSHDEEKVISVRKKKKKSENVVDEESDFLIREKLSRQGLTQTSLNFERSEGESLRISGDALLRANSMRPRRELESSGEFSRSMKRITTKYLTIVEDEQMKIENETLTEQVFDRKLNRYRNCDPLYFQLEIIVVPILTTLLWLLIPVDYGGDRDFNFYIYFFLFTQFYNIWLIMTTLLFFDWFVLPLSKKKHWLITFAIYLISLPYGILLKKYMDRTESDWYVLPGVYYLISIAIIYLLIGGNIESKRNKSARLKSILLVEDPALYENLVKRTEQKFDEEDEIVAEWSISDYEQGVDLGDDYYGVKNLLRAEKTNSLQYIIFACIFQIFWICIWLLTNYLAIYFTDLSSILSRTLFTVIYKILALILLEAGVLIVSHLPRKHQLSMIISYSLDSLFIVYWKTIILSVTEIPVLIGTCLGVIVVDLVMYPGRMTKKYFKWSNWVFSNIKFLNGWVKTNYCEYKRDLALEYFCHASAALYSVQAILFCVSAIRYMTNSPFWIYSVSQVQRSIFLNEMYFQGIIFIVECLLALFINFILCRKYLSIDPFQIGMTLMTQKRVRYLLIGLSAHFLHDFLYINVQQYRFL